MDEPLYTAALAAFLLLLQITLMLSVGLYRGSSKQFIGIGDDPKMEARVRRHANLAENAGLFLAAIAILEIIVGQTTLVAGIADRLCRRPHPPRDWHVVPCRNPFH